MTVQFAEIRGKEIPDQRAAVDNVWAEFVPFLQSDPEIRRIACTTNAIESVKARIRKAVKAGGYFPNEQAAPNCVYLSIMALDPTGKGRARLMCHRAPGPAAALGPSPSRPKCGCRRHS